MFLVYHGLTGRTRIEPLACAHVKSLHRVHQSLTEFNALPVNLEHGQLG